MVIGNRVWSVLKFKLFESTSKVPGNVPGQYYIISNDSNFRKQNPKKISKIFIYQNPQKVFLLLPF